MGGWTGLRRPWVLVTMLVIFLALLLAAEIYFDDEPVTLVSLIPDVIEFGLVSGAAVGTTLLVFRTSAQEEETRALRRDIDRARADGERWRVDMTVHLHELGAAIQRQLTDWRLTPAEQEVGFLLLKGFSHKEIARLRKASEATVRQQAASIYEKSGLSGRAALSAFFLEDLLAPASAVEAPNGTSRLTSPAKGLAARSAPPAP